MKRKYQCKICLKEFSWKHALKRHHGRIHPTEYYNPDLICQYCGTEVQNPKSFAGHISNCRLNPNFAERSRKLSMASSKKRFTKEQKQKISNTILEKAKNGTWHNSFRKKSKIEYNGFIFDGNWEVLYAKYLDANNIKWHRNKKRFQYVFEEKSRTYTPDFYIPDEDLYIEVKGYATEKDAAKWNQFNNKLKVVSGKFLKQVYPEITIRDNWKIKVNNSKVEII